MSDRKYRQQGYQNPGGAPRGPAPRPPSADGPRGGMLGKRAVSRCGACGVILPIANASLDRCPSCHADIHACRQCAHFDPGKRFQCAEAIAEARADKNARNDCSLFSLRVAVERDASPDAARTGGARPGDARRGFDNLFKS